MVALVLNPHHPHSTEAADRRAIFRACMAAPKDMETAGGNVEELEARVAEKEKELEALRQSLAAARNQSV